jgi:radical SAM-linked protein
MRRLLVKYSKEGDASYLSHREAMRAMERALRRSGLPLAFTEGFSPRPRMSFSPALPLGVSAQAEYLEVSVEEGVKTLEAKERMNLALPRGLKVCDLQQLAPTMPKLSRWVRYGLYRIDTDEAGEKAVYVVLQLSGEEAGRLKDVLEKIAELLDRPATNRDVTRVGLYASPHEVHEDARGRVYFYDGKRGELEEMEEGAGGGNRQR